MSFLLETLTKGKVAEIKGTYIKVAGEDAKNGIYLTNTDTKKKTKITAEDIVTNEPSSILFQVPSTLEPGTYELSVVTQSSTGKQILKEPRRTQADIPIIIA